MTENGPAAQPTPSVADYYDRMAETWDRSHGSGHQNPRFARQIREQLKAVLSNIGANAKGLEIGAGTGPYVDVTAPLFGSLVATDLSEGMLGVFGRRISSLGLTNVTLLREDACELRGIEANSMDAVYSIGLLETVADFDRLFASIHRVLKPNGVVAGITSNGTCPWYAVRRYLERGERHGRTGRMPTASLLAGVLQRSGFTRPDIGYWGALPPGVQSPLLGAAFAGAEALVAPTPLARLLGVMTFRSRKLEASA